MDIPEPLRAVGRRINQTRGAWYEGDIFSILKQIACIIRSFEFALADGAVDCSREYEKGTSWAERYWDVHERRYLDDEASKLMLFEAKSTVGIEAGEQVYMTTVAQQRHVAFYIGMNSAEPTFVDVIPNYLQVKQALEREETTYTDDPEGRQDVKVNTARMSVHSPRAYAGIDQCSTPYRMPISFLAEAIARIRRCALGEGIYINPWTAVEFPNWKPLCTTMTKFIRPADKADHATAYEAFLDLYRTIRNFRLNPSTALDIDVVGLQPSLADFKILLGGRQYFVQHKLDMRVRSAGSALDRVGVARGDGTERGWYFSSFSRFDFLWFQFHYSKGNGEIERVFFFVPERELPNILFTTLEKNINFEDFSSLQRFRMVLDADGAWIHSVERILHEYSTPRSCQERPLRVVPPPTLSSEVDDRTLPDRESCKLPLGRCLFAKQTMRGQKAFFRNVLRLCAHRGSGLLVVMATLHPWSDFGYLKYKWSAKEKAAFARHGDPPQALHHLSPNTLIVPISYYTQHAEAASTGPNVRARHFRRLDASREPRITIWDISGPDGNPDRPHKQAVIPSDDIEPSNAQRRLFQRNLSTDKNRGEFEERNPTLSALLKTGLLAAEYGIGDGGPLSYESNNWSSILEILDQFISLNTFEHPQNHIRQPTMYQHTVQSANQRLVKQHELSQCKQKDGEDCAEEVPW